MNAVSGPRVSGSRVAESFVLKREQGMLSAVVPCFNELETIGELVRRATKVAQRTFSDYELILVDDGSRDGTWEKIAFLAKTDPHIICIS
jgi:glycosyltransferase involved in cell wall biosynthesis